MGKIFKKDPFIEKTIENLQEKNKAIRDAQIGTVFYRNLKLLKDRNLVANYNRYLFKAIDILAEIKKRVKTN